MPGLIAYIAMITAVVSTALSVVREKERGTMEQIRMAPISAPAYVLGKTTPYFVVSLLSAMGIVGVSMLLFDLPVRGSWLALLGCVSLFLVGALAFGAAHLDIAPSQQMAFQIALLTSFLPTLMLSGFIFPISSMPAFLQTITHVVPARYSVPARPAAEGASCGCCVRGLAGFCGRAGGRRFVAVGVRRTASRHRASPRCVLMLTSPISSLFALECRARSANPSGTRCNACSA